MVTVNLYPAIDLYQGKVVRLRQGDFNACTVYSNDPAEIARDWENEGARWIHVVDLEGAKAGSLTNGAALSAILRSVKAKIQFGGGVRNLGDIEELLDRGVARVVVGTKAVDRTFLETAVRQFGDRLAVGLDVRNDHVKTAGWTEDGSVTLAEALKLFNECGVNTLIYTDIEKDGALKGPNWGKLRGILRKSRAHIILSGGISRLTDIEKCRTISEANFEGAIIGKALYDKRFTLNEALRLIQKMGEETHGQP